MIGHSVQARGVARETGWDLDRYAAEREWSAVGIGPVGQSRDSDPYEASNFAAACTILDDAGARYAVASFGHWAVGWVEELAHDMGDPATVAAVAAIRARLDRYPLLDEDDAYAREWSQNHPDGAVRGRYCFGGPDCHPTDRQGRIIPYRDERGRFARF